MNGSPRFVPLIVLLFTAAVLYVDFLTPLGGTAWVLYLPVILAPVWLHNLKNSGSSSRQVLTTSVACSVLVVVGLFLTHPDGLTIRGVRNRAMGLVALWLTTISGIIILRRSRQLTEAMTTLQLEISRHTTTSRLLEKSEERIRLAMEGAGMGTFDCTVQAGKVTCSSTQLGMLGFEAVSDGEITVEMWRSLIYPDDLARIQEVRELARRRHTPFDAEYRIKRADNGEIVWLAVFGRYLYNSGEEAERFLGVSFDITQRKELEREVLEITAREQRHIGQELHDSVGQELTGLGLMAQSLNQRLPASEPEQHIAARLVEGLNQVHQQIRGLAQGLIPVEMETKGLWAALDDLATSSRDQSGVPVHFECPEWVEMPDHGTSMQLFSIAKEAVSNALRHANPQSIRLTLLTQPNGLRLRIKDDGVGMMSQPKNGNGLGIRIMEYRAALIGAVLQIDRAGDRGTVVTVTLPRREADENECRGSQLGNYQSPDRG